METANGCRNVHDTGVVVVHAVYIRPYLNLIGIYCRSDQRSRIVATATLEIVDLPESIPANVTLRQEQHILIRMSLYHRQEMLPDIVFVRLCILVGAHIIQSRQHGYHCAHLLQIDLHHGRAHQLAEDQHTLFLEEGEALHVAHMIQGVEDGVDGLHGCAQGVGTLV